MWLTHDATQRSALAKKKKRLQKCRKECENKQGWQEKQRFFFFFLKSHLHICQPNVSVSQEESRRYHSLGQETATEERDALEESQFVVPPGIARG